MRAWLFPAAPDFRGVLRIPAPSQDPASLLAGCRRSPGPRAQPGSRPPGAAGASGREDRPPERCDSSGPNVFIPPTQTLAFLVCEGPEPSSRGGLRAQGAQGSRAASPPRWLRDNPAPGARGLCALGNRPPPHPRPPPCSSRAWVSPGSPRQPQGHPVPLSRAEVLGLPLCSETST